MRKLKGVLRNSRLDLNCVIRLLDICVGYCAPWFRDHPPGYQTPGRLSMAAGTFLTAFLRAVSSGWWCNCINHHMNGFCLGKYFLRSHMIRSQRKQYRNEGQYWRERDELLGRLDSCYSPHTQPAGKWEPHFTKKRQFVYLGVSNISHPKHLRGNRPCGTPYWGVP